MKKPAAPETVTRAGRTRRVHRAEPVAVEPEPDAETTYQRDADASPVAEEAAPEETDVEAEVAPLSGKPIGTWRPGAQRALQRMIKLIAAHQWDLWGVESVSGAVGILQRAHEKMVSEQRGGGSRRGPLTIGDVVRVKVKFAKNFDEGPDLEDLTIFAVHGPRVRATNSLGEKLNLKANELERAAARVEPAS